MKKSKMTGLDLSVMRPLLESLLKNMEGGVLTINKDKRIMSFNKAAEWITGYCLEEVIDKPCHEIIKSSLCNDYCPFNKVLKTGIPKHQRDVSILGKDDHNAIVSYSAFRLDDVHGNARGMTVIFRDITELTNLREQLLQSEKLAVMGQLAAGVAHEINNPINGILTYLHLLIKRLNKGEIKKDVWKKDLKLIERETKRIGHLVRNLLNFSRKRAPDLSPVILTKIIDETLPILEDQCRLKNIKIIKHCSKRIPEILADYVQMQQVLLNLILNAIQAVRKNGKIEIRVRVEGTKGSECFVYLEVIDNGVGIAQEDLDKIFDPFYTTKTGEKGGIGLGLSIIRQIVKAHHGRMNIKSTVKKGTTVSIRFPTR